MESPILTPVRVWKELFPLLFAGLFFIGTAAANTYTYTSPGGDFTVPTSDNPAMTTTIFELMVTDFAIIDPGDSVSVTLSGLQYPYASDLQVTLSFYNSVGSLLMSGDLFNQIGITPDNPAGDDTQFGGIYTFDSNATGNLWGTAGGLGSQDTIPSAAYWTTTAGSNANDELSTEFAGLPINGTWVLMVNDYYPPFVGSPDYNPGITEWELDIQATATTGVPEPSTGMVVASFLGLLGLLRRRRALLR